MKFEEMFEHRELVALKLKEYIRENGYTKVSLAEKAGISRPTLDKLLNGSIENRSTFEKHLNKILKTLSIAPDTLMFFDGGKRETVDAVFSENTPSGYDRSEKDEKLYSLLMDILELCDIYY